MAKNDWWFKFDIRAWRNSPELRKCSLPTRGFWIDCIAIMRDTERATISGTVEDIARAVGCFPDEARAAIEELKRHDTATVTLRNDNVTLKSRRYAKELKAKELTRLRVRKHRGHSDVTPEKHEPLTKVISNKKEVREESSLNESSNPTLSDPPQAAAPPKPKANRGSRIPDPFLLTADMRAYASEKRPNIDVKEETEKFVNHFRSATGRNATKLDWQATWRNWILNAKERTNYGPNRQSNGGNSRATSSERIASTLESIANEFPTEAELGRIG